MPHPLLRWTALAAAAVLAAAVPSCSELTIPPPTSAEAPLFEVEMVNFAWGPFWKGAYIARDGRVYGFDLSTTHESDLAGDVLTPELVTRKYDHGRELVKTLPSSEAVDKYGLVSPAALGPFSDQRGVCADAGVLRYSAWIYDAGDGKYHRLLLHQSGDVAQANLSDAARELYHWLEDVTGMTNPGGCDPFEG
jgi:predicted heme/steroid binding protein